MFIFVDKKEEYVEGKRREEEEEEKKERKGASAGDNTDNCIRLELYEVLSR